MMSDLLRYLYENDLELRESKISPAKLVEMIGLIDKGVISGKLAKTLLPKVIVTGKSPNEIVEEERMFKISDRDYLKEMVDKIFVENPKAVQDALADEKAVHFLIGQLMKATHGKADPSLAGRIVNEKLNITRKSKTK